MDYFWDTGSKPADAVALVDAGAGTKISYGELGELVAASARRLGAGRGIAVLYFSPKTEVIATYLALLDLGYPIILQDPGQKDDLPALRDIFPIRYVCHATPGQIETDPDSPDIDLHPDLRLLLSTSGSTGAKKFVRLSAQNIASNAVAIADYLDLGPGDAAPSALPLSYSYGMSVLNSHLQAGARFVLSDHPITSKDFWNDFADTGCTSFSGVPQSFSLLEAGGQLDRDLPSLRYVTQAGGKLQPDAVGRWCEKGRARGWDFIVMYGQTECAPRISWLPPKQALLHPGSIGQAIPGGRLSVVDEDGKAILDDAAGEFVYEGPNVMMGYATKAADLALPQGPDRLSTGDIGFCRDGLFFITGRKSRFVKLAGKRIGLDEIEGWITEDGHAGVAVGNDDRLGLVHTGGEGTGMARRFARRLGLTDAFVLDIPVDTLPLNHNGKVDLPAATALLDARAPDTTAPEQVAAGQGHAGVAEMQALWAEVLDIDEVPVDKSFYDLGGDSLTALSVVLRVEALGVDAETARQIFDGKTIAELTAGAGEGAAQEDAPPATGLDLTQMINAVHATRGFLALWVVAVHWLPGAIARIAGSLDWVYTMLAPLWRFGTPGFAMVFGMGISALRLSHYIQNRAAFARSNSLNTKLVAGGVIALGVLNFLTLAVEGRLDERLALSGMFYSAITYYALALLCLPLLVRLMLIGPNRVATILVLAILSMTINEILAVYVAPLKPPAFLEFLKIVATAKFGFFRMTGYVMIGAAIGVLFRKHRDGENIVRDLVLFGVVISAFGALGIYQAEVENLRRSFGFADLWQLAVYVGALLVVLAGFAKIVRDTNGGLAGRLSAFFIASGILALPIFVGHELVLAVKRLCDAFGIPDLLSLVVIVGVFMAAMIWAYARVMRYFGRSG